MTSSRIPSKPLHAGLTGRIVTACLALGTLTSCSSTQPVPEASPPAQAHIQMPDQVAGDLDVKTETIAKHTLSENLHLTGQVRPNIGKETDIESRFSGRVLEVPVKPGDEVRPGQMLALIDSHEISSLQAELIEACSQLAIAHAHETRENEVYQENLERPETLINARTHEETSRVALQLAEADFKRVEGLRHEKIASEKDYLQTKATVEQARLAHSKAVLGLQREERMFRNKGLLRKDLQLAEASSKRAHQHLDTLKQRLEFYGMPKEMIAEVSKTSKIIAQIPLRCRVSGTIVHQDIAVGELVQPGKKLFTVTDLSTVIITVDLPEVDLQWVKPNASAKIGVASYPDETFTGRVSYIADAVNPETRTVPARIILDNKDRKLKLNMFAEIFLATAPRTVLSCPKSAVQEHEGHKVVFVKEGSEYKQRKVELGSDTEHEYEVISGLNAGDQVVTQGSLLLKTEISSKQVH